MKTNDVSSQTLRRLFSRAKARLLPAALLFCLLASPAWAQTVPDELIVPEDTILFRGTLVAQEGYREYIPSLPTVPPILHLLFFVTGSGIARATDVGPFTVIYAGMTDYSSGAGPQCARFINATGDSLFTSAMGQVTGTKDPSVSSIREIHTVIGGTGEYSYWSGSFTVQRTITYSADGLTGSSQGTFNGYLRTR